MGSRYWVGGTSSWNGTAGTKWALTTGGAGGQAEPTSSDDVHFDSNSGANTVTVATTTALALSVDFTGFTGTFTGSTAMTISGSLTLVSGMTNSWTGTLTFNNTSGTATITSNTKALDSPITFNGVGGTFSLADALVTGATRTVTLTNGTFTLNNQNMTCGLFSSANANVRTITLGTGNTLTLNGTGAITVLDLSTTTNLTFTAGSTTIIDCTGSTASTRTITTGSLSIPSVKISAGSGAITFTNVNCLDLTFTNSYSGTIANQAITIRGSLTLSTAATYSAGASVWTMAATSTGKTITPNGKTTDFPFTFNGVGGGWTLAGDLVSGASRTIILTAGTFSDGNYNLTVGIFQSNNSNTRTLTMGTGNTWTLNATGANVVFDLQTTTGLTFTAGSTTILDLTGSTASIRTIAPNSILIPSIRISGGSGSITFTLVNCLNLIFTSGYTGTLANQTLSFRGNITLVNTATYTAGASAWTYVGTSGTGTWTSAGVTTDWPITINGVGGTLQLADTFTHGSTRTLTLTNGTFDANSVTATFGLFSSSNSNTRTIATGTGTWTFPTTGTVWDTSTSTNLTITGTATIDLTANSATARTITGGSALLPSLNMATGSFNPTFTNCNFLNFTNTSGWTGTLTNQTLTIRGNIVLSSGGTYSSGSNIWTWANTSGTVTWTTAGKSIAWPILVNGTGGIHQNADAMSTTNTIGVSAGTLQLTATLTTTGIVTLTAGTIDTNGYAVSSPSFVSSNSNIRAITFGATTWTLTSTGVIWDTSTSTNLTWTPGTGMLDLTNATITQRCVHNGSSSLQMCSIKISAGTGFVFLVNVNCNDLNWTTGFTGVWGSTHDITVRGNLTLPLNGTVANGTTIVTLAATSGTKSITSNGKTLYRNVIINAPGGTHQLADALTLGSVLQARTLTLTAGTFDANNFAITADRFASSNTNTRAILLGSATHIFTGAGTVWDCTTSTNLTVTKGTSTLKFIDGTATTKTFMGGGKTYYNIKYSGSGSGIFLTGDSNTFNDFAAEKVA